MNHYELLYLVPATHSEEELAPVKETIKQLITKHNGQIKTEDSLGKRKLAYPIKKFRQGYYLLINFDSEPENIKLLENDLRLTSEILRHMLTTKTSSKPSVIKYFSEESTITQPTRKFSPKPETKPLIEAGEKKEEKVNLEDLDKKLDEILEGDIM